MMLTLYRLAPNNKYPAAHHDAYAAVRWVAANAASFGGDARKLAVGGDSAGGNLSIAAAMQARDQGGPHINFMLLIYPVTDNYKTSSKMMRAAVACATVRYPQQICKVTVT